MFTNPETRTQQRHEAHVKLNSLFNALDNAETDIMKDSIKHEIRKLASDSGISSVKFPARHKTDNDLEVLKERIRKKLSK